MKLKNVTKKFVWRKIELKILVVLENFGREYEG